MLTQAEIDALLAGAIEIEQADEKDGGVNLAKLMGAKPEAAAAEEAEDVSDRKVRPYNFWSPDRFSKDQMRAIELVHEELGERLSNTMPTFLRTNVRPRIVHTEQGRFHDFLSDLHPNSLFHLITLAPLPGQMLITISQEVSFIILEQRLGGRSDPRFKDHVLTDIDQSLLQDLIENMLNDIKASWSKVTTVEPKLVDSTTNQHWVQMMIGNERVMMVTFEIMINQVTGTMSFYVPYSMVKPVINDLNTHRIITGRKEQMQDPTARRINFDNLCRVILPVRVLLGSSKVAMKDIVQMRVGDVFVLNTNVKDELTVEIAKKPRFVGRIGRQGNKLAIQINGTVAME
ncbi:MAG: flagellar motor switch protein FliM [Anaerolineae bacterium]|nr:flagellar motor switch protein FliM [Anaerolineae bacterium]